MAGGITLYLLMKHGLLSPDHVVSLRKIPDLNRVELPPSRGLRIGALALHGQLLESSAVKEHYPLLWRAASVLGSVQVRNRGTVGGNLCHGDSASDLAPALLALDAKAHVVGTSGRRQIPLEEFFVDLYETALAPDELLEAIEVPPPPEGAGMSYQKFERTAVDHPVACAAALCVKKGRTSWEVRLALGALASKPVRAHALERALSGHELTEQALEGALGLVQEAIRPVSDVKGSASFKRELAEVLARRAILEACPSARTK
jgi:carbon-monoxide dehydrogenase medium subunit